MIDDYEIQSGKIDFTKTPAAVTDIQNKEFPVSVPNVTGLTVSEARKKLEDAGFTDLEFVNEGGDRVSSGTVTEQTPAQNEKVIPSTKIRLTVGS